MNETAKPKRSTPLRLGTIAAIVVGALLLWRGLPGSGERADSPVPQRESDSRFDLEPEVEEAPPERATLDTGQEIVGDFRILSFEEVLREGGAGSAMSLAIEKYPEKLEELLSTGVFDANMRLHRKDGAWEMPIVKAMRQGTEETFAILMAAGADPNQRDSDGKNALHYPAYDGLMGAIEIFLEAGADPSSADYEGSTPMRSAAFGGQLEVVEALLAAGADPEHSALWAAASAGHDDIVRRLAGAGAQAGGSPGHEPAGSMCPMWHAAMSGHLSTVRLLLELGAPAECGNSIEPAEMARRQGHDEVAALLESRGAS